MQVDVAPDVVHGMRTVLASSEQFYAADVSTHTADVSTTPDYIRTHTAVLYPRTFMSLMPIACAMCSVQRAASTQAKAHGT